LITRTLENSNISVGRTVFSVPMMNSSR